MNDRSSQIRNQTTSLSGAVPTSVRHQPLFTRRGPLGSFPDCPHNVSSLTCVQLQVHLLSFPSLDPRDSPLDPLSCIFHSHLLTIAPHCVFLLVSGEEGNGTGPGQRSERRRLFRDVLLSVFLQLIRTLSPAPPRLASPCVCLWPCSRQELQGHC